MSVLAVLAAALAAYLIGSIPFGYIVVRLLKGIDVRQVGSGRTGGTNSMRAGGLVAGFFTAVGDIFKGFLAVVIARAIVGHTPVAEVIAGFMAVIGHNWSIYLGFKGGAGTSPNVGASIAFWPISGIYLVPMIPFGLFVVGYASVTSMMIAAMVVITFVVRAALRADPNWWYVAYAVATAAAVLWALRPNIKRLREGTERMIGLRAKRSGQTPQDNLTIF